MHCLWPCIGNGGSKTSLSWGLPLLLCCAVLAAPAFAVAAVAAAAVCLCCCGRLRLCLLLRRACRVCCCCCCRCCLRCGVLLPLLALLSRASGIVILIQQPCRRGRIRSLNGWCEARPTRGLMSTCLTLISRVRLDETGVSAVGNF